MSTADLGFVGPDSFAIFFGLIALFCPGEIDISLDPKIAVIRGETICHSKKSLVVSQSTVRPSLLLKLCQKIHRLYKYTFVRSMGVCSKARGRHHFMYQYTELLTRQRRMVRKKRKEIRMIASWSWQSICGLRGKMEIISEGLVPLTFAFWRTTTP